MGSDFWRPLESWMRDVMLARYAAISPEDLDLFSITDDVDDAVRQICHHHEAEKKRGKAGPRMTAEGTVYGVSPQETRKRRTKRK